MVLAVVVVVVHQATATPRLLETAAQEPSGQVVVVVVVARPASVMASAVMVVLAVLASCTFTKYSKSKGMAQYAVIKEGYVLNVVEWDPVAAPDWTYPFTHDSVVLDANGNAGIGDWYETAESIFYRPINAQPPDWPQELLP